MIRPQPKVTPRKQALTATCNTATAPVSLAEAGEHSRASKGSKEAAPRGRNRLQSALSLTRPQISHTKDWFTSV